MTLGNRETARGTFPLVPAGPAHWPSVETLLSSHRLPLEGAQEHSANFLVALASGNVVGAIGLEVHGRVGLLRSLAVHRGSANRGLGTELVAATVARAQTLGLRELYLLTTSAADFFARRGFERVDRSTLPAVLAGSRELQGACPASATAMRLALSGGVRTLSTEG